MRLSELLESSLYGSNVAQRAEAAFDILEVGQPLTHVSDTLQPSPCTLVVQSHSHVPAIDHTRPVSRHPVSESCKGILRKFRAADVLPDTRYKP